MDPRYKPYSNPTQLLGIALEGRDPVDKALVALPNETGTSKAFEKIAGEVTLWHHDWSLARHEEASFGLNPPSGPFDLCLLYLPKGVELQGVVFSAIHKVMKKGGRVLVVGEKKSGIASTRSLLRKTLGNADHKHSARHCLAWDVVVRDHDTTDSGAAHEPPLPAFAVNTWGVSVEIVSSPGAFAQGHLDDGTKFLLDSIDDEKEATEEVLDWGCGSGVIGTIVGLAHKDSKVTFADSSAIALDACRRTLKKNNLEGSEVIASDGWSDLGEKKFDLILSNPPAHKGFKTDRSATEDFLEAAPAHLNKGGKVILVANGHLPYLPRLEKVFADVKVIARNPRFQIIQARV